MLPPWMQSGAMPAPSHPPQPVSNDDESRSLLSRLQNVGEFIADRFNNPPDERSQIGTAGNVYRRLTQPSSRSPSERPTSWLRPVRPLAPTTREKNEDRFGEFLGAIRNEALGDPNATVQMHVDEDGQPIHTLSVREFAERYPGQTHPTVEAASDLAALAFTGGMPFAVRGALGSAGGWLRNRGVGHHWVPKKLWKRKEMPPEAKKVFDRDTSGRIPLGVRDSIEGKTRYHQWDEEHRRYSDGVEKLMDDFLAALGKARKNLTPQEAGKISDMVASSQVADINEYREFIEKLSRLYLLRTGG
jgi:hypothetical protein